MPTDVVPEDVRQRMMAGIKGKNTQPEKAVRSALHRLGFRFRIHGRHLPGRPDLIFPKHKAVIFVHGCFWHGHGCHLFKWPKTRAEFWQHKIRANIARDGEHASALASGGWRVATIWECSLKGRHRFPIHAVAGQCAAWLTSNKPDMWLSGDATRTVA